MKEQLQYRMIISEEENTQEMNKIAFVRKQIQKRKEGWMLDKQNLDKVKQKNDLEDRAILNILINHNSQRPPTRRNIWREKHQ